MPSTMTLTQGHFVAVYVKKAQADFKGFLRGGLAVNFEAKHTDTPRMEQDRVTPEQADRLERAFRYQELREMDMADYREAVEARILYNTEWTKKRGGAT